MRFVSTKGQSPPVSLKKALFTGLAPDGGLYMPVSLPSLSSEDLLLLGEMGWEEMATNLTQWLLEPELGPEAARYLIASALDFPLPLVPLQDYIRILELFHGPTLAFKDVGARFMAHLMASFRKAGDPPLTILTATSGDTGGAVAHAFLGQPGIRVVVLFPDGKVSRRQEHQFSTLGRNVLAVAVQGDFDDCQRMVKAAFQNQGLRKSLLLTSANSINVGRLLPQSFFYFWAWAQLRRTGGEGEILFTVPSGNFGNLAAGLMAKKMGLPDARFLAVTNANDGVPLYLETGRFQPRPSLQTLSTAMDVGDPSNLARIVHLYADGGLKALREDLTGCSVSDRKTRACIRRIHEATGYILDPHSAVGMVGLEEELRKRPGSQGILLATAHPAKFAEVVEPVVGEPLPPPPELQACLDRERRVHTMAPHETSLELFLRDLSGGHR